MTAGDTAPPVTRMVVDRFSAGFRGRPAIANVSLEIRKGERLAVIGPAQSGKTTLMCSLNRLNDRQPHFAWTGRITLDGADINGPAMDVAVLRRRVGMVYAVPVPLPWSIYDNIAYGPRLAGTTGRGRLDELVETSLRQAVIWDEVKDRLAEPAHNLSGGQQQRMCLARVLALQPDVLLLDEPCSGLDPISTAKIEDALDELKSRYAIVLVTNNTKQAARASERTAFLLSGELVEVNPTEKLFTAPDDPRTNDYVSGRFG